MGSKIEKVLFIFILITAVTSFFLVTAKYEHVQKVVQNKKSTELNEFTEYDVNQTALMSTLQAKQAYERNNIWFLSNPVVSTDKIEYIKAKRALAKSGIVEFIDKVKTLQRDGKKYFSNKVFYKIRTKEIVTPGNFIILNEFENMQGASMVYDTDKEVTRAKNVKAVFKTNSK